MKEARKRLIQALDDADIPRDDTAAILSAIELVIAVVKEHRGPHDPRAARSAELLTKYSLDDHTSGGRYARPSS